MSKLNIEKHIFKPTYDHDGMKQPIHTTMEGKVGEQWR